MNDQCSKVIALFFAWLPYILVALLYATLAEGSFWSALGVLLAFRLFFSAIETLGGFLTWRLYGRSKTIERNLSMLRVSKSPRRQYAYDDFLNYLSRIADDDASPQVIKSAAASARLL